MNRRKFLTLAALAPIAVPAVALLSTKRDVLVRGFSIRQLHPNGAALRGLPKTIKTPWGPAKLITDGPYSSGCTYATALGPRDYGQILNNDWGRIAQPVGESMFLEARHGLG